MTDGKTALSELTEISSQVEAAVLFGADGKVVASTLPDTRAEQFAASAKALFDEAGRAGSGELTQLEAATADGSLFVVRDGELLIAASTGAEPTSGLVFYDLKACLRKAAAKPAAKRPVRGSGRGEGARGNREVPPAQTGGAKSSGPA
jgi:predicted regulator of Ras-like GTPase activity (Roadblock/LC7/MglB family)